MSRVIYHYPMPEPDGKRHTVPLTRYAKIVHVGLRHGIPTFWVEVEKGEPTRSVKVVVVGTGWDVPEGVNHQGTVITPEGLVWHLYAQL